MLRHLPLLSRQREGTEGSRVLWRWITGQAGSQVHWGAYRWKTGKFTQLLSLHFTICIVGMTTPPPCRFRRNKGMPLKGSPNLTSSHSPATSRLPRTKGQSRHMASQRPRSVPTASVSLLLFRPALCALTSKLGTGTPSAQNALPDI